jgi:hypothetical protein
MLAIRRLIFVFSVTAVLCHRPAAAWDVRPPAESTLVAHPTGGETYLTTSDIVVTGVIAKSAEAFVVQLKDSAGVICSSASGNTEGKNAMGWATPLTLRKPWQAGVYQIEVISTSGRRTSIPITIIDDNRQRDAGRLGKVSELTDEEVDGLPVILLPEVTVNSTDTESLKVTRPSKKADRKDGPGVAILLPKRPFAFGGVFRVEQTSKSILAPIVLQIVEERKTEDGEKIEVIVNEDVAEPDETESGFQFAKPMLSPAIGARYVLRALYREAKLGETVVELKAGGKPGEPQGDRGDK